MNGSGAPRRRCTCPSRRDLKRNLAAYSTASCVALQEREPPPVGPVRADGAARRGRHLHGRVLRAVAPVFRDGAAGTASARARRRSGLPRFRSPAATASAVAPPLAALPVPLDAAAPPPASESAAAVPPSTSPLALRQPAGFRAGTGSDGENEVSASGPTKIRKAELMGRMTPSTPAPLRHRHETSRNRRHARCAGGSLDSNQVAPMRRVRLQEPAGAATAGRRDRRCLNPSATT